MKSENLFEKNQILPISRIVLFFLSLFYFFFFLTACSDGGGSRSSGSSKETKRIDWDIHGTWKSNEPTVYDGTLKVTYDRITITGYTEDQTPLLGNDNQRPFKDFTKSIALKGYTENGKIFIEDGGQVQEGLSYTFWNQYSPEHGKTLYFLRFNFGGRNETLQLQ